MDAHRFDRIARIVGNRLGPVAGQGAGHWLGRRRGRREAIAALAGAAALAVGRGPAAAAVGRPLGMTCANVLQCTGLGACGWPGEVRCESDWGGEPVCCLAGGEPCNADRECCGQLSCLMADDSCGAGFCGAESAAGMGPEDDANDWEASTPIGVECGNGVICTGEWETCGLGIFVDGPAACCLADGAPCSGEGQCCHTCLEGTCVYLGRGGLAALEDLNLRSGPGTEFEIIGVVTAGTIVDPQPYWRNGYQLVELPWASGWVLATGLSGHAG